MLPPETKLQVLEQKLGMALWLINETDKNIKQFGLVKEGSLFYEEFYKMQKRIYGNGATSNTNS